MKKLICSALILCTIWGCNQEQTTSQVNKDTTAAEASNSSVFGSEFEEKDVISVAELQEAVQEQDSIKAIVKGKIASSCQSKGCWMDVKLADNTTMKVTFKDYGFFLPVEDLTGKEVVFTGTAKREEISVDDQRHYAKDAGKSENEINQITKPKQELRFVADGVILK